MPVLATQAKLADIPVWLEGVGSAKARNLVTVRPQVDGKILSIDFKEGQEVKKGDRLAQIDPVTFQAQLDQALAKKALDEAQLANARRDLERHTSLTANVIAAKTVDTQRALVAQLEAQIKQDQAAIENAQAILGYASVVAPISGRSWTVRPNRVPAATRTRLARQWGTRAMRAVMATSTSEVVVACLGVCPAA